MQIAETSKRSAEVVLSGPIEFHTGNGSILFAFERAFFVLNKTSANIQNPVVAHYVYMY